MNYNRWDKDLNDATRAIESIENTILPRLISGKLHSVENSKNEILLLMDKLSGIDLIREDNHGLQGVAARVQFGSNFKTFTIRSKRKSGVKTELEKRFEQIKHGYFYPAFTLQAYFDCREKLNLQSIAIIKTVDLYSFIETVPDKIYTQKSDNFFKFCYWRDLKKRGFDIKIIENLPKSQI